MAKYRKKPVVIEAIQWTGKNIDEIAQFTNGYADFRTEKGDPEVDLLIRTLEGVMYASYGDYIIRGIDGEYYPCKPEIFKKTYEYVSEN